jgi:TIR domain
MKRPDSPKSSPRQLQAFLCHSSGDKLAVYQLFQRLKEYNIDPWLDKENLLPGQDWDLEIQKAVRKSDVVLICLSPDFIVKEGYGQKEIKLALDTALEKPEGTIFLIPLKLEKCELPQRLKPFHAVNYFEENGFDKLISALKYRVQSLQGKVEPLDCKPNTKNEEGNERLSNPLNILREEIRKNIPEGKGGLQ